MLICSIWYLFRTSAKRTNLILEFIVYSYTSDPFHDCFKIVINPKWNIINICRFWQMLTKVWWHLLFLIWTISHLVSITLRNHIYETSTINNTFRCRNNRRLESDNPRERRIGISRARFRTGYFVCRYTADYCNDGYADSFFRFSWVVRVINYELFQELLRVDSTRAGNLLGICGTFHPFVFLPHILTFNSQSVQYRKFETVMWKWKYYSWF